MCVLSPKDPQFSDLCEIGFGLFLKSIENIGFAHYKPKKTQSTNIQTDGHDDQESG